MTTRIPLTRPQIAQRALLMLCAKPETPDPKSPARPVGYRNDSSGRLGGDDPTNPGCWDWSFGDEGKERVPTSDCVGLAMWCAGLARRQPGYKGTRGEWLNCGSILDDARSIGQFFELVEHRLAEPGDFLVSEEHIGVIIRTATCDDQGKVLFDHLVVDCSPRHSGHPWSRPAIGTGVGWSVSCVVVRLKT